MAGLFTKKKKDDGNNKDKDNNNNNNNNNAKRPAPPPNGLGLNNPSPSNSYQQPPPATPTGLSMLGGPGSNGPLSPLSPTGSQSNSINYQPPPQSQQSLASVLQASSNPNPANTAATGAAPPTPQLFWTQRRILGSNPFPRFQHSSSVTSTGTDIFVYGGSQRGSPKGDLFVIDSVSLQCQAITPAGADQGRDVPMPKSGHSAVNIGQYIIFFGGWDQTTGQCDDSLHVLHTARREWNKPLIQGTLPTPRHSHIGCSVGTTMYIFGGQVDNYYLGDIISFDMKTITQNPRWEIIEPQSESPPARSGHCAAVYEGRIYIFGGADADYFYNDIWCFDTRLNTWTPIPASGYLPSGRHGHACTIVDGVFYVFGGNSPDGTAMNDAYAFRINERRWYLFQSVGSAATPRVGHSMVTIKDKIYIVGGESEQIMMEDPAFIYYLEIPKIRFPDSAVQVAQPRTVSSARLVPNRPGPDSPQLQPENPSSDDQGQQQQYQQPPASIGRPDRPNRPERPLTQRPASPATFAGGDNKQGNARPLTTIGAPPPRGASVGIMNGTNNAAAAQEYQGDGITMSARRQTLKEDISQGYDSPRAASPGANRRTMHQAPTSSSNPSPLRSNRQTTIALGTGGEVSPIAARFDRRATQNPSPAAAAEDEINPYAIDVIAPPSSSPSSGYVAPPSSTGARQNPAQTATTPPVSGQMSVPPQNLPSSRSPSPANRPRANSRATPTPPPQLNPPNQPENPVVSPAAISRLKQLEQQMKERDEELALMRKRENWLVTEVMLARQGNGSDHQQNQQLSYLNSDKRLSMTDLEQEIENRQLEGSQVTIAKALLKLKEELRNSKMSIATQAQAASLKIKEAERIRTGALQEAAYLKAKLSSMSNAQQDPGALARVEMERAADLEKRLTTALGEMELLESQFNKAQESLQQEKLARFSAEERSNNSSVLAEQAQTAHDRALSELSSLHSRATKAEAESREYAAQLAESQAGFSGHQSQSTGLLQKIADLRHQVEEHQTALGRTQMAYSAANDRAIRAEELCDESSGKLEKLESLRSELASDLTRYKGEAERLQSKVEELEGRYQISKDEVITLRKLVEDGLGAFNPRGKTQELSAERKHDSIAILNTVSKVSGLEQELNSLKALHKSSQATASKSAAELADAMMEISRLEQSSMKAKAETISLQRQLAEERELNSELRNEITKAEQDLEEKIKEIENYEVQLGLLKDVMREKGIIAEDVMLQAAIRGSDDYAATLEEKVKQSQERSRSLEQELEESREHFSQQLESLEAQRQATVQHAEKTNGLLRKLKNDLAATIREKEIVEQNLSDLEAAHAQCGEMSSRRDGQSKQEDERIHMLQMHWDEERRELSARASNLENQLMEAEMHAAQLSQKVASTTERIDEVETVNEAMSEELESVKGRATKQEAQLKSDVERLVSEVHRAQETIQQLEAQLDQAQAAVNNAKSGANSEASMSAFSQQRQELEQRLKKAQETIQILEGDNSVLEARLQDSEKKVALLLEDMQNGLTDASHPHSPLNSTSLAGIHQQLNQHIPHSVGQSNAALNSAIASSSPNRNSPASRQLANGSRAGSSNSTSSRYPGASPSLMAQKKNSPSPNHHQQQQQQINEDDLYHYGGAAAPSQNGGQFMNGHHLGIDDEEDVNSSSYRDSVDSITRELEMLKVPWNKASGAGAAGANQGGRKSSSPLQQQYQQQQQHNGNYYGNGSNNNYYNDDEDEDENVSYLAHLQQHPSQQQQQQQYQQSNYNSGNVGTMDTHSFNDRSPSRLKEYEQMIDEIENSRRQH
ncbi:Negative regulator of mitotic exit [Haplosporangium sp. Z 27]|nr:Negative regulator of mitotic exit [Haplosporangium sp. Z 27]